MKSDIIGKLLAVALILVAIWTFDWHSWNQIFISVLLFLSGIIILLMEKKSLFSTKLKNFLQFVSIIIVIIMLINFILSR